VKETGVVCVSQATAVRVKRCHQTYEPSDVCREVSRTVARSGSRYQIRIERNTDLSTQKIEQYRNAIAAGHAVVQRDLRAGEKTPQAVLVNDRHHKPHFYGQLVARSRHERQAPRSTVYNCRSAGIERRRGWGERDRGRAGTEKLHALRT
jgi:hypothetical protein